MDPLPIPPANTEVMRRVMRYCNKGGESSEEAGETRGCGFMEFEDCLHHSFKYQIRRAGNAARFYSTNNRNDCGLRCLGLGDQRSVIGGECQLTNQIA